MNDNEYRCVKCGGVFEKGWSDEEAEKELSDGIHGDIPVSDCAIVCDDCWKEMGFDREGPKLIGDG